MSDEDQKGTPAGPDAAGDDAEAKAKAEAARAKAEAAARAKAEKEAIEAAKPAWEKDPVAPQWGEAEGDELAAALAASSPGALRTARTFAGDLVLEVELPNIAEVGSRLKSEHGYELLVDICGAHYPKREEAPFEVVYHLYNMQTNRRVRLKVATVEASEVPTVSSVWRGANWLEREVYDMYGVRFRDHPDMTRILLWEGFNGYPLRKDFPVEGIDTGSAIYPEYYEEEAGPVTGTGTGWKPAPPPAEEPKPEDSDVEEES